MVNVNSTILNPPSMHACMALGHASDVGVRRTAQARMLANVWRTRSKSSGVLARSRPEERERVAIVVVVEERRDAARRRAMITVVLIMISKD